MDRNSLLKKIYSEESCEAGRGTFKRAYPRGKRFFLAFFGFVVLLLGLATLSFYLFPEAPRSPVAITIEAPSVHPAGAEIHYRIKIENRGDEPARQVTIKIAPPSQFYFFRSEPPPASHTNQTWTFLSIAENSSVTVDITGQLLGEVGERKRFEATVRYQPPGYSFLDEQTVTAETLINRQGISLWTEGPSQLKPDEEVTLTVHYRNDAEQSFSPVQLELVPPSGWTFLSASQSSQRQGTLWPLGELAKTKEGSLVVRGKFKGDAEALQEWRWTLVRVGPSARDILAEKSQLILLKNGQQELILRTADGATEAADLSSSEPVDFILTFRNQTEQEISNSKLELIVAGPAGREVQVEGTGFSPQTKSVAASLDGSPVLIWEAIQIPALASLLPGAGSEVRVRLSLVKTPLVTLNTPSLQVQARWRRLDQTITSPVLTLKPTTEVSLGQTIIYLNRAGEEIPAGDFSMAEGAEGNYRVRWEVVNGSSPLRNVAVKTFLPGSARFVSAGKVTSGEQLRYDEISRQITWQLNWLPAFVGSSASSTKITAEFTLAAKKTGSSVPLLKTSTLEALDDLSGKTVTVRKDAVVY